MFGYRKSTVVRKGELGSSDTLSQTKYWKLEPAAPGSSNQPIYPVAEDTVFRDIGGGMPQYTNYSYSWYLVGAQKTPGIETRTITYPPVGAAQNGPDASEVRGEFYNKHGLMVWMKDGDGYVHYAEYDRGTGAITKAIVDADTALGGYTDDSPWPSPSPSSARLKLTTLDETDALGRTTKSIPRGTSPTPFTSTLITRSVFTQVGIQLLLVIRQVELKDVRRGQFKSGGRIGNSRQVTPKT